MGELEFRILGPLEALDEGRPLPLGAVRQRAVLALLLTRANEIVSRDRLIEELWGDEQPESAVNVLQTYVSHLRKVLPEGVLETRPPGYLVRVEPGRLDLQRFEQLADGAVQALAAGRAADAASALREALGLWRGSPLADFAYEPFAQAEIARLEELRLAVLERRIEADLALGRDSELVAELEALVTQHPLRERLRANLMLALYRSGRQAEALAAYQDARRALVDELGIDPSPSLQELERAILRHDPTLAGSQLAPAGGRDLATDGASFARRALLVVPRTDESVDALLALAAPLARRPPRDLILTRLVSDPDELTRANAALHERRAGLDAHGIATRAVAFTTDDPGADAVRLAEKQDVDLVLVDVEPDELDRRLTGGPLADVLAGAPCDVGVLVIRQGGPTTVDGPVLVPFGGAEHEWAAAEIGAWVASAHGSSLRLLGTRGDKRTGKRDASRLLASVALMVQQVAGVATEPLLIEPGDEAVVAAAEGAALVVMGLPTTWRQTGIGSTRLAVAQRSRPPTLLVRAGLRPGGLAPMESMTRFTWTIAG